MAEQNAETQSNAVEEEEFELTPEIVQYENRRNDLILAAGVLAFAFFLGSFTDASPDLWLRFKSGEWISKNFPNLAQPDPFSYTAAETTWINPNWLFDWTIFQLYARFGDATLIAVKALVGVLAAAFLLCIRYPGPTQWWTNLCVLAATTAISVHLSLTPQIVSLALFAVLLWICFQARYRRRTWMLYLALPLAVLWANLDLTYVLAGLLLLVATVGDTIQIFLPARLNFGGQKPSPSYLIQAYVVGALCLVAGAATPYGVSTLVYPYEWLFEVLPQMAEFELRMGGWAQLNVNAFIDLAIAGLLPYSQYAWALLVLGAFASFFLNYGNLQFSRLLVAVGSVALGMMYARFVGHSSLLLAAVMALNCQEFYLEHWGTEIRISRGWLLWSQLGRAVTIVIVFVAILGSFTGWIQGMIGRFGYGIAVDQYMLEANQWLQKAGLQGRPFPFFQEPASFLAYASSERSSFCDGRWHLFAKTKVGDETVIKKFRTAREAIAKQQPEIWKPIFDEYQISHVIVNHALDPSAVRAVVNLFDSDDWTLLFMSDAAIVFGRTDDNIDKEAIAQLKVDANHLAFHTSRPLPRSTDRYVEAPGIIDKIWRNRYQLPPHYISGYLYSEVPESGLAQPGSLYLAIRELRNAIAANPDNPMPHFQLAMVFQNLYSQESTAFAEQQRAQMFEYMKKQQEAQAKAAATSAPQGADAKPAGDANAAAAPAPGPAGAPQHDELTLESLPIVLPPPSTFMPTRHYQIMSCLQNAVTAGGRGMALHQAMGLYAHQNRLFDLALHHLELAYQAAVGEVKAQLEEQLAQVRSEVQQRREQYDEAVRRMVEGFEQAGANSDVPLERARWAAHFELPMLAAEELENLSPIGPELDQAAPFAAALNLRLGRTQAAFEALDRMENSIGKQSLATGEWDWSMAQVLLLQGQYKEALSTLEHAIAEIRINRIKRTLQMAEMRVRHGEMFGTLQESQDSFGDIEREAAYLFMLGLLRLEMGEPHLAPEAFNKALELWPRLQTRTVIGFYMPLVAGEQLPEAPQPYDPKLEIAKSLEGEADAKKEPQTGEAKDGAGAAKDAPKPTTAQPEPAKEAPKATPTEDEAKKSPPPAKKEAADEPAPEAKPAETEAPKQATPKPE